MSVCLPFRVFLGGGFSESEEMLVLPWNSCWYFQKCVICLSKRIVDGPQINLGGYNTFAYHVAVL